MSIAEGLLEGRKVDMEDGSGVGTGVGNSFGALLLDGAGEKRVVGTAAGDRQSW